MCRWPRLALAAARSGLAAEQGGLARRAANSTGPLSGEYPGTLAPPPRTPSVPGTEKAAREVKARPVQSAG